MYQKKSVKFEEKSRPINFEIFNSRLVKVTPINKDFEVYNDNGDLIGLKFNKTNTITIGEDTSYAGTPFKVQKIKKLTSKNLKEGPGYFLYSHELNKSSQFTLPMLGQDREYFKWGSNLCNVFLGMQGEDYPDRVLLLYRIQTDREYLEFEAKLENHPMYVGSTTYDIYHDLVEFKVPSRFKEDYQLLINGKYSHISEELKKRIIRFHSLKPNNPISQVIHKSEHRKNRLEKELSVTISDELDLLDPYYMENELCSDKFKLIISEEVENSIV